MRALAAILLLVTLSLAPGEVGAAEWAVPPVGYAYAATQGCESEESGERAQRPNQAVYPICADQMQLFARGLVDARASGKLLLVTFGATWCPWCAMLQKQIASGELLAKRGDPLDFAATFHHLEIGLSTLRKGHKAKIPSGEAVLALVLQQASGVRIRLIPFVAVVDAGTDDRVFARNLDGVLGKDGAIDPEKFRAVLVEAHATLRHAGTPPSVPGRN